MKNCINCGREINEDVKFCPYCGAQQPELAENQGATPEDVPVRYEAPMSEISGAEDHQPIDVSPSGSAEVPNEETGDKPSQPAASETMAEAEAAPDSQKAATMTTAPEAKSADPEPQLDKQVAQQLNEAAQATAKATKEKLSEFAQSDTVKDLKQNSLNYFSYLHKNIKAPNVKDPDTSGYFGLVNFILITLFTGLGLSSFLAKAGRYLWSIYAFHRTGEQSNLPTFAYPLEKIGTVAALLFVYVVVYYVFAKFVYKQQLPFLGAFERVFSASSLVVYLSIAAFLLSFIASAPELFVLLLMVNIGLVGFNFAGALWTAEDLSGKVNRYYVTVLAFLVTSMIVIIVLRVFFGIIVDKMTGPIFTPQDQNIFDDAF